MWGETKILTVDGFCNDASGAIQERGGQAVATQEFKVFPGQSQYFVRVAYEVETNPLHVGVVAKYDSTLAPVD